ncbi:Rieske 2Fe-2S domain-containing protein [Candidatus Bathyarchaeota archaeon]|nr:Rieske 2Fe-2S domain-containing protein [Candidatus Bathyarchaeota archaeon]
MDKIETKTVEKNGRRNFLKYFLSGGLAGFAAITIYPILSFLNPPKQTEVEVNSVVVGKVDDFKPGDSKIIRFGNKPVIIIRADDNKFRAFSATCTHLDCTVQYKKDEKIIWCACHNGKYDLYGNNVSGPPPKPLDKFNVAIKNDELIVSREA